MDRIHDLTLTYREHMPGVSFQQAKTLEKDGWNAKTLNLYSHAGTHIDAPCHFGVKGPTIDHIPVRDLVVESWVVDLQEAQPSAKIEIEDLGNVARIFKAGEGVIFRTGWSKRLGHDDYRNKLPRISKKLALWCVEKKVKLIGVEPPSVANVNDLEEVTEIHQILFNGSVIIVEGLTNLESITAPKVTIIALPIKIENGDGAPARVIAIERG